LEKRKGASLEEGESLLKLWDDIIKEIKEMNDDVKNGKIKEITEEQEEKLKEMLAKMEELIKKTEKLAKKYEKYEEYEKGYGKNRKGYKA